MAAITKLFQNVPMGQWHLTMAVIMVGVTLLGFTSAYSNGVDNNGSGVEQGKMKVPKFFFGDMYCQVLCQKSEGPVTDQCLQCMKGKGEDAKRAIRNRRFDDFGLDDYLFMRLLGRNLEDRE